MMGDPDLCFEKEKRADYFFSLNFFHRRPFLDILGFQMKWKKVMLHAKMEIQFLNCLNAGQNFSKCFHGTSKKCGESVVSFI